MKTILIVYKGRITHIVYSKTVVFRKFDLFISYFVNIVAGTNVPVRSGTFVNVRPYEGIYFSHIV